MSYHLKEARTYLVSACLCGFSCRYDGKSNAVDWLVALHAAGGVIAVCPEIEGGLPTPRPPCEIQAGRVITHTGEDVTDAFEKGAARVLAMALEHCVDTAILKENSPSCGSSVVYDGSFTRCLKKGQGLTTALLRAHGIHVVNENVSADTIMV